MKTIFYILMAISIASCASSREYRSQKKMQKLTAKYPELLKVDTLRISDTIVTEIRRIDTIASFHELITEKPIIIRDTIEKVEVVLQKERDIIRVSAECDSDTIYINKEIPVERIKYVENLDGYKSIKRELFWMKLLLFISFVLNLFLGFKILFK